MRGGVEHGDTRSRKYAGIINRGRNELSASWLVRILTLGGLINTLPVWLPARAITTRPLARGAVEVDEMSMNQLGIYAIFFLYGIAMALVYRPYEP